MDRAAARRHRRHAGEFRVCEAGRLNRGRRGACFVSADHSAGSHRQVSLSLRAKRSNLLPIGEYGGDMKKYLTVMAALLLVAAPAGAADNVKIGFITTLSGPAGKIGRASCRERG